MEYQSVLDVAGPTAGRQVLQYEDIDAVAAL